MGKQAVSRNNSRYRSDNGSIRDRAYEISVGSYNRTYLTVPVDDMKYLGLMPDWGETAYLSEDVRRSWAGEYVYLEGEDKALFCSMYERVFGHAPVTHEKANGTRGQITRLPLLSEPLPTDDRIYDIPVVEYGNDSSACARNTTAVTVYNPILQSVTDFIMYMMVFHLVKGHGTQGPRLLDTKMKMLRQWVRSKTPLLSGTFYDNKTRLMWVYTFRTRFPVCPTCGKEFGHLKNVHMSDVYDAYQPHCSCACAALDRYVQSKVAVTSIARYNVDHPSKSAEIREKAAQTCLDRYGARTAFGSPIIRERSRKTSRERYGVDYPAQNPDILEKSIRTRIFKQRKNNKKRIDGYVFDSSWEAEFYLYCKNRGLDVEYHPCHLEYEFLGKKHRYYPDFRVGDKLYEIKGECFINDDGTWWCPFKRGVDPAKYEVDCGKMEAKRQCAMANGVIVISRKEMDSLGEIFGE